jgi:hypothetical protein
MRRGEDTRNGRLAAIAAGPKPFARIIDHVGNVIRHQGPPDKPRVWTLDARAKRGESGAIPTRVCGAGWPRGKEPSPPCYNSFERFLHECPHCGLAIPPPQPSERSSPEKVDGDLVELDAETLAKLRGDVAAMDMSLIDYNVQLVAANMPPIGIAGHLNRLRDAQAAQAVLRAAMEDYVRARLAEGLRDRQIHKAFFLTFGVDVLSARALNKKDAEELRERIARHDPASSRRVGDETPRQR